MTTRRMFIQETAAAALIAAGSAPSAMAEEPATSGAPAKANKASSVTPRIKSVIRRDDTLLRLGGNGAPSSMTWNVDDQQIVSIVEGGGWPGLPDDLYFQSALFAISGRPQTAFFEWIPGYPPQPLRNFFRANGSNIHVGGAMIAINRNIYQFLGSNAGLVKLINDRFVIEEPRSAKLIYSTDNGRTWRNPDGSTPLVFESPQQQSRKTMLFFDEPFTGPIVLQMGKGYEDNRDGYVYVYSNSSTAGSGQEPPLTVNEIVMFRVPKRSLLDRGAYEYFGGLRAGGAIWVKDINARVATHRLPPGWRCSSIVYNKPLGLYMMAGSWGRFVEEQEKWAWSPSKLGFWVASTPWGPWEQIHEEAAWTPGGAEVCALGPEIAPKWIAADGKSFWLVWTDFYHTDDYRMDFLRNAYRTADEEEYKRAMVKYRTHYMANYRFNVQRVDLVIGAGRRSRQAD